MRRTHLVEVMLVAAILLMASNAMAGEMEDTETLDMGDYVAINIDNSDKTTLDVVYEVVVTDGVNVNIYFMDTDGFADYEANQTFEFHEEFSEEDTDDIKKDFIWNKEGEYYMVIDSTATEANVTTTVEYTVTWDNAFTEGFNWIWCIAVIVIVVIITVVLAFMRKPGTE